METTGNPHPQYKWDEATETRQENLRWKDWQQGYQACVRDLQQVLTSVKVMLDSIGIFSK
jgi:hypothetical protein